MENNGARFKNNVFMPSEEIGKDVFNQLYGIETTHGNIEKSWNSLKYDLPTRFLPIGDTPGGDQICISLKEDDYGYIYDWQHDYPREEPIYDYDNLKIIDDYGNNDMSGVHFLSKSFSSFLQMLTEE